MTKLRWDDTMEIRETRKSHQELLAAAEARGPNHGSAYLVIGAYDECLGAVLEIWEKDRSAEGKAALLEAVEKLHRMKQEALRRVAS